MNLDLINEITSKSILHFNAREFEYFPIEFQKYGQHTVEIYLKWNKINNLPPWISTLKSLTNLYLSHNMLLYLPDEISLVENLEVLVVNNNHLVSLPGSIGLLLKLKYLNVSMNKLPSLPAEICQLSKLQILMAEENILEVLPENLCLCQSLEEVILDNNLLRYIPLSIVYLPRLTSLSLSYNNLLFLPAMPFISNPLLKINCNPDLNYGSYQLLHQNIMSHDRSNILHLKNNRCCFWEINSTCGIQIQTLCNTDRAVLYLPRSLKSFTSDLQTFHVTSLLESCTRQVSRLYQHQVWSNVAEGATLPYHLDHKIRHGPVAQCFSFNCQSPIFGETVGWLVHTEMSQIKHCVLFFCSTQCARETLSIFCSS